MPVQSGTDSAVSGPHFRSDTGPDGSVCGSAGDGDGKTVPKRAGREQRFDAQAYPRGKEDAGEAVWQQPAVQRRDGYPGDRNILCVGRRSGKEAAAGGRNFFHKPAGLS